MLLYIKNLSTKFQLRGATVNAVRNVSLSIDSNETLGIVGESGSGKSVLSLSLLRLLPQPPAHVEGNAFFGSYDLVHCTDHEIRSIRGNKISMIFQDPLSSFNPYLRLSEQLVEPLLHHQKYKRTEAIKIAIDILSQTGITDPEKRINAYPHQFSGGMLQRVMIAMALVTNPQLIIADEPTTALDVTTQAQILKLMKKLQQKFAMSIIFITHNLGIAAGFCDRVLVMYAGTILESADTRSLFKHTAHPYTKALIRCVPALKQSSESLYGIGGPPYDPTQPASGCPFAPRCSFSSDICKTTPSELTSIDSDHYTACIRIKNGEISL